MKIRSVVALLGLAIGFAVPTFAQEKGAVDPQTLSQLDAKIKKYDDAINKNDAAAVAASNNFRRDRHALGYARVSTDDHHPDGTSTPCDPLRGPNSNR